MSIEYFAAIEIDKECLAKILHTLREDERYQILRSEDSARVLLRFTRAPLREKWPEDVELRFGEGVYVAFHAADRTDREGLLGLLMWTLEQCGHSVQFFEE